MRYLIIDAYLNGTGVRDKYKGNYIDPFSLSVSSELLQRLSKWLKDYQKQFLDQYSNSSLMEKLDTEGIEITLSFKRELGMSYKFEYYSDYKMKSILL